MTEQDKQLLLKDLCARLPYGVKGIITYNGDKDIFTVKGIFNILFLSDTECCHVEDFKPYLRPLSSMTEEERNYYNDRWFEGYHAKHGDDMVLETEIPSYIDWLNAHHFDYRGLIEKGLAIEVTEGMYNDKT